jgi:cell division transport system permease protein
MSATIFTADDVKHFKSSWVHHTGMQLTTLAVLTATMSVIAFALSLAMNFKNVLASWGDTVQVTAYLADGTSAERVSALREEVKKIPVVDSVEYVDRETATNQFKSQMASYAPTLLNDSDFANPFPASLKVHLRGGVKSEADVKELERVAAEVGRLAGVEDVSYGQSWVQNFSSAVSTLNASGAVMITILIACAILVIGNSVRAAINTRREEIEILELVGATQASIRRPYIFDGFAMGAMAAIFAVFANVLLYFWQMSVIRSSLVLGRLTSVFGFLPAWAVVLFVLCGGLLGALGAWLTVRKINDGWSAIQKFENS